MRTVLIVMADVMVLVVALLAVTEFQALRRFSSFTVPFTDRLIAFGAMKAGDRERVLREDRMVHIIGIALCVVIWLMLAKFFAGVSALIDFPAGVAALLLWMRPDPGESEENRSQYFRAHRRDIDPMKYAEYVESCARAVGDGQPPEDGR